MSSSNVTAAAHCLTLPYRSWGLHSRSWSQPACPEAPDSLNRCQYISFQMDCCLQPIAAAVGAPNSYRAGLVQGEVPARRLSSCLPPRRLPCRPSFCLLGPMAAIDLPGTAVAPLERVGMDLLLKNSSRVGAANRRCGRMSARGVAGFWKGNGLNLLRTAPFKVGRQAAEALPLLPPLLAVMKCAAAHA